MKSARSILSILITTYNREDYLEKLLGILCEYQKLGLVFNIVVSDDFSTDNTENVCYRWKDELSNYKYVRLSSNQGMDRNFLSAYLNCETEYCWLLGDHRYVEYEELKRILSLLEKARYDALILNCHPKNNLPEKEYNEINGLLIDLGYNITNNASCIIPKRFVTPWAYKRFINTTFLHMGIFVENLCMMDSFRVLFVNDIKVKDLELPVSFTMSGWNRHAFLNFGKLWFECIMSLPNQISIENKFDVLLSHNRMTGIFDIDNVLLEKQKYGDDYVKSYKENRQYMKFVSDVPLWRYDARLIYVPLPFYKIWGLLKIVYSKILLLLK